MGPIIWQDGHRMHGLTPEGHMWRWRATYDGPDVDEPVEHDFGLIPGGIYVAVERLLEMAEAAIRPIPTSERLPTLGEMVLIWAGEEWDFAARHRDIAGEHEWWAYSDNGREVQFAVKFWIPVPPDPE